VRTVFAVLFFAICLAIGLALAFEAIWLVMRLLKRRSVNRRPNLTPDRRPILTPSSGESER